MKAARVILWGKLPIERSAIPESLADLASWPTVDRQALDDSAAKAFDRQAEAVRLFVEEKGVPMAGITARTGVHREQLYRLLERCLKRHQDGRIYGFRGAMPYKHLKDYERREKVRPCKPRARGGGAGAMQQLLRTLPKIGSWLSREARMRDRKLGSGEIREIRKSIRSLHREFLKRLRAAGVTEAEWPFNREEMGFRSFQAFFYTSSAREVQPDESEEVVPGIMEDKRTFDRDDDALPAMSPFDTVQFDGHKLDVRVTISFKDQLGLETLVELTRIWVLVCLDVASRAVLGYSIVYAPEYDSDDVARALQSCFGPHRGPAFTIPAMRIREGGGFPNSVFEEAHYPAWRWFLYDSARANLAEATLTRLTEIVGCFVKSGRLGEPDDRSFMERFFAVLARSGLHRVAGTTGSSPDDLVRELADVGSNLQLLISTDELEQVIECLLGDYNGESHSGLNGRTPLAAMQHYLAKPQARVRKLPTVKHRQLIFLQEARLKDVRGRTRPYVNFAGDRYTSDVLSSKPGLHGKKLRIYFNIQDIRQIQAFFDDGSELGTLMASRSWRRTPHTLRQRQEILRLRRLGKLHYREGDDAIEAYVAYKRKLAKNNKKAASALAELAKTISMAEEIGTQASSATAQPTSQPPYLPDPVSGSPSESAVGSLGRTPSSPVKPKPLAVRRTFTF